MFCNISLLMICFDFRSTGATQRTTGALTKRVGVREAPGLMMQQWGSDVEVNLG